MFTLIITVVAFILVFSILVLVHEFGHFMAAKRSGIKVEEFGIGFPPRIWGRKKGDTLYSINAIPFGGFVRLLGMEGKKRKGKLNLKNFSDRSMRVRAKVMVAGVVMNLFLAWLLLSVGFVFGMEPLLGPDDVFTAVDEGVIVLQEGAVVESIEDGKMAAEFDLQEGDVLYEVGNHKVVDGLQLVGFLANPEGKFTVVRENQVLDGFISSEDVARFAELYPGEEDLFGVEFNDAFFFPRVKIHEVSTDSNAYKAGLRNGDVVLAVNGSQVYALSQYKDLVTSLDEAYFSIVRDGVRKDILIDVPVEKGVIISSVVKDEAAEEAGIQDGDVVLSVNGKMVQTASELVAVINESQDAILAFSLNRGGVQIFTEVTPKDGKIGVYLSELYSGEYDEISVYNIDQYTSVLDIEEEQYPFWSAPVHAFGETWRMTKMTGVYLVDFLKGFFSSGEVPEGITGPVGIAKMTGVFAMEGIIPLIRFVALLSISLAVLNILPFPALDGGKLLFILIEFVAGRKVPSKWENYIHYLGYILILVLFFAVTYKDIVRWLT
jgi:regulator of sigma E protease